MQRLLFTGAVVSLFILTACPRTPVDVGDLGPDAGDGGGSGGAFGEGGKGGELAGSGGSAGGTFGDGGQGGWGEGGGAGGGAGGTLGDGGQGGWGEGGAAGSPVGGAGGSPPVPGPLGATCELGPFGPSLGLFDSAATDCASRLCVKPVDQTGVADTSPLCTTGCATDADCVGLLRNPANPIDKRCTSGFTCGVAFVKGALCCRNLCLCKDFTGGQTLDVPIACQNGGALSCL